MSNQKKKSLSKNKIKKNEKVSFQSDIVIDENGEISISFFGPELLHLLNRKISTDTQRFWRLPELYEDSFQQELNTIKQEYTSCTLCPKECGFDRTANQHANCGDWKLKISNFGISFGDEIEISDGGGSGLIFLNGCHLTCPSCINEEKVREDSSDHSILNFLKMCETLYIRGANNIQILSPTVSLPHLRIILKTLKKYSFPLPVALKSSGHESLAELKKLEGLVDIYIPDYKFSKNLFWQKKSGAIMYHETFMENVNEMYRQVGRLQKNSEGLLTKGVMIRHVLNPYIDSAEKNDILKFLRTYEDKMHISILDNFVVLE